MPAHAKLSQSTPTQGEQQQSTLKAFNPDIERIYHEWDDALSKNDIPALLVLYAPDATLESPLVPHLMGTEAGVCRGREELKRFFEILKTRKPKPGSITGRTISPMGERSCGNIPIPRPRANR